MIGTMAGMQVLADTDTLATWLAERRDRGQDRYDYMDEGRYVVAPMARTDHQDLVGELVAMFRPVAREKGLRCYPGANVGTEDTYRVPDVVVAEPATVVYLPTALLVVEVLSPGEVPMAKLGHYERCMVSEYLEVDPQTRTARLLRRTTDTAGTVSWADVPDSNVLGLAMADVRVALGWR